VGVGDGSQTEQSQQLDSPLGKVLRMTLDGKPSPGNPFYQKNSADKAASYVWASGFRNPFGLKIVGDDIFVADNGPAVDRFLRINPGGNYLWDGSDFSIGTNADAVLFPGKGVAQIDFYPTGSDLFPKQYQSTFYVTVTGSPAQELEGVPAILLVQYDFTQGKVQSVPRALLRYRGQQTQVVAGLGFGPDGLYFLPMIPNESGMTLVLKVTFEPAAGYPFHLETETNPVILMNSQGCFACHTLNNNGGGSVGPVLDRELLVPRLQNRLTSEEYILRSKQLDLLDREPFISFRAARQAVNQAKGLEQVALWLEYRIQEPRFDDPQAQMPSPALSKKQAKAIAAYLAGLEEEIQEERESKGFFGRIRDWFPTPTRSNATTYGAVLFVVGFLAGGIGVAASFWIFFKRRRRRGGG